MNDINESKIKNKIFNKWVGKNKDDLGVLYECFYDNSNNFLNIKTKHFSDPKMFKYFCKFIYEQTSSDLKDKHLAHLAHSAHQS